MYINDALFTITKSTSRLLNDLRGRLIAQTKYMC